VSGAWALGEARMILEVEAATDVGLRRPQNEDSHGQWIPAAAEERNRRGALLVVADGMGGSRAGEVASRLAVDTVLRCYREAPGLDPLEDLHQAVEAANRVVHDESAAHPEMSGMGTTCTAVVLRGADAYIAHVGDSRAYLVRDGAIRQLTRDHSLVAQLVRDGQLTPEQARVDPRRNVVTRSVGVGPHVEIDADPEPGLLRPGDTLLICSDGLHGVVADDELKAAASKPNLAQGCRDAIALANSRGGPDNITVVMARIAAA
jgi:PPM family protein phosphatase